MNKNISYSLVLITAILITSCNDEFLDRYPESSIVESNFWNSESDLITYNNQLYAKYFADKGFGSKGTATMLTDDNLSDNSFPTDPGDVRLGIHTADNPGKTNWDWSLIRNINIFLEHYENTDIDELIKYKYAAEARLLRALDYYDKVKMYGSLPLIDKVPSEDDEILYKGRVSRDEIVQFIMEDLNFAEEWLPETAPNGRFNKYIGLACKARIMLHEGTFRKYHDLGGETAFLQSAAEAANEVIESSTFMIDMSEDYYSLFSTIDLAGNMEVIFYKDYDPDLTLFHNTNPFMVSPFGTGVSGTKSLINDYLCTDGLPITESPLYLGDDSIANEFANRDERLKNTFALPNDPRFSYFMKDKIYLNSSPKTIEVTACPSGYHVVKFYNEDLASTVAYAQDYIDAPLFRYAEVLLIYAEARTELGEITQADLDKTINLLRKKAGVSDMNLSDASISEIRRERRVELAFEGKRYDDLMRWKQGQLLSEPVLGLKFNGNDIAYYDDFEIGEDIFLDKNGYIKSNYDYSFDESKHYYFPIPVNELSLNPNLGQTQGWGN